MNMKINKIKSYAMGGPIAKKDCCLASSSTAIRLSDTLSLIPGEGQVRGAAPFFPEITLGNPYANLSKAFPQKNSSAS